MTILENYGEEIDMAEDVKLFHGDCLEVMKDIPDNSVDLVVTDPPYKIVKGGCTNKAVKYTGTTHEQLKSGELFGKNEIKFKEWIPIVYQKVKDGSHVYIMCNDRNMREVLNVAHESKFKLLNILTWKKTKHNPNRYYLKNSEFIIMLRKGKAKNINNMGTFSVLEVANVEKKLHPSDKPVDLMQILVENSSQEGEIVLDPFMGAGSTGVACMNTNRRFIGIELDENYFNIAKERIKQTYDQIQE